MVDIILGYQQKISVLTQQKKRKIINTFSGAQAYALTIELTVLVGFCRVKIKQILKKIGKYFVSINERKANCQLQKLSSLYTKYIDGSVLETFPCYPKSSYPQ